MLGEVFRLHAPRSTRGHERSGSRHAVVVQSDQQPLSTWLVAPTITSASAASVRPEVEIGGRLTRVLAEHTAAARVVAPFVPKRVERHIPSRQCQTRSSLRVR